MSHSNFSGAVEGNPFSEFGSILPALDEIWNELIEGGPQPSNISNADLEEKKRKKKESDMRYRTNKKQMIQGTAQKLGEVTAENYHLRKENAGLKEEQGKMKGNMDKLVQKVSSLEKEIGHVNSRLQGQTSMVEVLSEKLIAGSEATQLLEENIMLKGTIELFIAQWNNPEGIRIVALQEENEKLKCEAKRLKVINDALCYKISGDNQ